MKYYPANDATVAGVGNMRINIQGQGTVLLESQVNNQIFILKLESVLHVPTNRNGLVSLGRWDGTYNSKKGEMTLKRDGKVIAMGRKIKNNLYKLNVSVHKAKPNNKNTSIICAATEDVPTWETWH